MQEQKKVTPVVSKPTTPEKTPEKIDYQDITKKSLIETLKEKIPKGLTSSKRIGKILGAIFMIVLIIAGLQFPFDSLISGNMDATINIGYPLHFLKLGISGNNDFPFLPINFLLDLIMYTILAYIIDIFLSLILNSQLFKSKKKLKNPTIFKNQKPTSQSLPTHPSVPE